MPERYENNPFNSPMSTPTPPRGRPQGLPPFRPLGLPPVSQEDPFPGGLGMEGVPAPEPLDNPQYDQGWGESYGELPPLFPTTETIYNESEPAPTGPPIGGPRPYAPQSVDPFGPDFVPNSDPQSYDRYKPNYIPPYKSPPPITSGRTSKEIKAMEEARNWKPTGKPPAAMQPPIR